MPKLVTKEKSGFSLIEIVLSLFLILALVTVLLTASGTFLHSRKSNLLSTAQKISSREIERMRNLAFASIPTSGTFNDGQLLSLPSGVATRTVTDYQSDPDIKHVTITVTWTESAVPKEFTLTTLISEHGL